MRLRDLSLVVLAVAGCTRAAPRPSPDAIDLHLEAAPIYSALRELAKAAAVNIDADSGLTGEVTLDVHGKPWRVVLEELAREHHLRVEQTGPVIHVSDADKPAAPKQTFSGAPIAVDFDETPVRDAMKVFAEHTGLSFTVDVDVQTNITLRLKKLPWDLALDHLARKYALKVIRTATSVRISKQ